MGSRNFLSFFFKKYYYFNTEETTFLYLFSNDYGRLDIVCRRLGWSPQFFLVSHHIKITQLRKNADNQNIMGLPNILLFIIYSNKQILQEWLHTPVTGYHKWINAFVSQTCTPKTYIDIFKENFGRLFQIKEFNKSVTQMEKEMGLLMFLIINPICKFSLKKKIDFEMYNPVPNLLVWPRNHKKWFCKNKLNSQQMSFISM